MLKGNLYSFLFGSDKEIHNSDAYSKGLYFNDMVILATMFIIHNLSSSHVEGSVNHEFLFFKFNLHFLQLSQA